MKPAPGLVVIYSVALGAILPFLVSMAALLLSKSRHPDSIGTVISITFWFWLLAGPVFRNRGTVSGTGHSKTFILI